MFIPPLMSLNNFSKRSQLLSLLGRKPLGSTLTCTNSTTSTSIQRSGRISDTGRISRKLKLTRKYHEYTQKLLEYLAYFFERTEPLQDLQRIFSKVIAEFEERWSIGSVEEWENENRENGNAQQQNALIDLDFFSNVEQLMEVGPEKLKEALVALGLKSGGTLQQRAERLFLTKDTPLEKLDKKHFANGSHFSWTPTKWQCCGPTT